MAGEMIPAIVNLQKLDCGRMIPLSAAPTRRWASLWLARLQRLLLHRVPLRQLLRLLLMLLLHLLRVSLIRRLLMFRLLLLLKLLPLLVLGGDQLVLFRFVLLIGLCVSGVDSRGAGNRRNVVGMNCGAGRGGLLRR